MPALVRARILRTCGLIGAALLCAVVAPATAGAAWNQPVGGDSPINLASNRDAVMGGITAVAGVPHVAWVEWDGTNNELRVARLNSAGTGWEEVVGGPSPINYAADQSASGPVLASIGGVPYVAWREWDGTNAEVRVSRLNSAGTAWEEVVGGASPINAADNRSAEYVSLASVGGVPHVAWSEFDALPNLELRVARLNPDAPGGPAWEEVVGGASPINAADNRHAAHPSITAFNGVPHVAWTESDGTTSQARVTRLNAGGTAWEQIVGGASPINHAGGNNASQTRLAAIGGVLHVTWVENDPVNAEIRVSRLNAGGTDWVETGVTLSPINHDSDRDGRNPSIADVGGVPYVAWTEYDGANREARVSRLPASSSAWEQVVGGASPINQASTIDNVAENTHLAVIGGVPYVAWDEEQNNTNREARVSRLEPEFTSQSAVATAMGATLTTNIHTYGVPFGIGFEYGAGLETATQATPVGVENATVTSQVTGLSPATAYSFRPFAAAGVPAPRVLATTGTFTTLADPGPGGPAPVIPPAFGAQTNVSLKLAAARIPARGPVRLRLSNSNPFAVTGQVSGKGRRRAKLRARSFTVRARGRTTVRLKLPGKLRRELRRRGRLTLRLTIKVKDPAGNTRTVKKTVKPKLKKRKRRA